MRKVKTPDGVIRNYLGDDDENVYNVGDIVNTDHGSGIVVQANIDKTEGKAELRGRYYWVQVKGESEPVRIGNKDLPQTGLVQMSDSVKVINGVQVPKDVAHFPVSALEVVEG